MKIVNFAGQGEIFDAQIFRDDVDGLGAMLRIVLQSFQTCFDEGEDFRRIVFDLFFRRADASRRITGEIISRVREPAETFTVKNHLARRAEQTRSDEPSSQRRREFLGRADDDRSYVFVWRQTMLSENQLGQEIHRAAA